MRSHMYLLNPAMDHSPRALRAVARLSRFVISILITNVRSSTRLLQEHALRGSRNSNMSWYSRIQFT